MPDETDLSGDCSDDNVQSLTMIFKGFTLFMLFKKTPGGERWYVSTIDLAYSSSNPLLKQIDRPNLQVSVAFFLYPHCLISFVSFFKKKHFVIWIHNLSFRSGEIDIRTWQITIPDASWQIIFMQWIRYHLACTGKQLIFENYLNVLKIFNWF